MAAYTGILICLCCYTQMSPTMSLLEKKNSFCPLWWGLFTGMTVRWILKRLWTDFDDFFSVDGVSDKLESDVISAGRSGLAVACLTAVRQVLGSNRAGPVVFITQPLRFTALGTGCVHLSCSA